MMQSSFPDREDDVAVAASNDVSFTWHAKQVVLVSHNSLLLFVNVSISLALGSHSRSSQ
jgi:hypothetical protein